MHSMPVVPFKTQIKHAGSVGTVTVVLSTQIFGSIATVVHIQGNAFPIAIVVVKPCRGKNIEFFAPRRLPGLSPRQGPRLIKRCLGGGGGVVVREGETAETGGRCTAIVAPKTGSAFKLKGRGAQGLFVGPSTNT